MFSRKPRSSPNSIPSPDRETSAQSYADSQSFAGLSDGTRSVEGDLVFWPTETFRGPVVVGLSDSDEAGSIGIQAGSLLVIHTSDTDKVVIFDRAPNSLTSVTYQEYVITPSTANGPFVAQTQSGILAQPWHLQAELTGDAYMKVIHLGEVDTSQAQLERYEQVQLDALQVEDFYRVYRDLELVRSLSDQRTA